uniref:Uncharacterized protein n=1 Tax=Oryza nivara TaxID=4536 RepID=A0A0E0HSL0_ORYNI
MPVGGVPRPAMVARPWWFHPHAQDGAPRQEEEYNAGAEDFLLLRILVVVAHFLWVTPTTATTTTATTTTTMTRAVLQESSSCCGGRGDDKAVDQLMAATTPASQLQMDYTMDQLRNDIAAAVAAAAMASRPSPVWEFRGSIHGTYRCCSPERDGEGRREGMEEEDVADVWVPH